MLVDFQPGLLAEELEAIDAATLTPARTPDRRRHPA
jgi:hypothetical protein